MSGSKVPETVPEGKILLGYEDFWAVPDDGNRYEVLEGEMVVTPPPGTRHQLISSRLQVRLAAHAEEARLGLVLAAPIGVILGEHRQVQPDLVFVRKERYSIITPKEIVGPPDLVVEILSPATARRDRLTKAALYASSAIPSYWIVDPEGKTIEEYRLEKESYALVKRWREPDRFEPEIFPGLSFDLASLFAF